jgi:hypothetical protein
VLALACTLVPSKATRPSFSAPASSAIFSTSSNSPASVAKWSLRKSAMVRKFGALPAASTRNPTSSAKRRSMRRELNTPTQYPYTSTLVIIRGS